MPPRFDPERLSIELSVADLLETALLRHLGFGNRGGYERMWLGQAIHSQYQEEAISEDPTYRREVVVSHTFEHRGWQVRVSGRADGIRRAEDGALVLEEIKSVRRGATLSATAREIYTRQALIYAWMLWREREPARSAESGNAVRAELVLIEIGGAGLAREQLEFEPAILEGTIRRRLNGIIRSWEAARQAGFRRHAAGEALRFPFGEPRRGQDEIIEAVDRALEQGDHLLLEAPTGIGKTVAAIYPALRYALRNDKRLFVLTAKTTQQAMAVDVLRRLAGSGAHGGFRATRLRAKSKMCANEEILCHEEYCRFARDFFLKLDSTQLVPRLLENASDGLIDPSEVYAAAKAAEVCPFEVGLDLAGRAQVVVCDYNYAFDPYVALADFAADADLSDTILLIDEVHNLVDRGRGYYSPELSSREARATAEAMGRRAAASGAPVHDEAQRLAAALASTLDRAVAAALEELPPQVLSTETALPEEELWRLRPEFDAAFVDYLEHQRETKSFRPDDPFVGLYFSLLRFLDGLLVADESFSKYVEQRGDRNDPSSGAFDLDENGASFTADSRIKLLCRDPSQFLGAVIGRTHATVGLSATLTPADFFRDLLGFASDRTTRVSIPSPFPAENRRLVVDTTVTTVWAERPLQVDRIAQRLSEFADAVPGNTLALFPSYDFLAQIADRLRSRTKRVLVQRRADTDAERDAILETLRKALFGDVLLLAVAGGVFAEGVDYPGDVLRAVAVVGPCLPGLSLEQELLKRYYQERFERGFEFAFVVPGMTRVIQAAGRLIRSPTDQGVIALFDRRFLLPPYRDYLPADWLPAEGAGRLAGDPAAESIAFFAALDGSLLEP